MKNLRSCLLGLPIVFAACWLATSAQAALIGSNGYTNDFSTQPPVADWSFMAITGGAGDVTTPAQMDTAVQAVAASAISNPLGSDPGDPPVLNAAAQWSSSGLY